MDLRTILEIAGFIAAAGGAYAVFNYRLTAVENSMRGHVNGIGGKTNKIILYLHESAGNEKSRERITDLFK